MRRAAPRRSRSGSRSESDHCNCTRVSIGLINKIPQILRTLEKQKNELKELKRLVHQQDHLIKKQCQDLVNLDHFVKKIDEHTQKE